MWPIKTRFNEEFISHVRQTLVSHPYIHEETCTRWKNQLNPPLINAAQVDQWTFPQGALYEWQGTRAPGSKTTLTPTLRTSLMCFVWARVISQTSAFISLPPHFSPQTCDWLDYKKVDATVNHETYCKMYFCLPACSVMKQSLWLFYRTQVFKNYKNALLCIMNRCCGNKHIHYA